MDSDLVYGVYINNHTFRLLDKGESMENCYTMINLANKCSQIMQQGDIFATIVSSVTTLLVSIIGWIVVSLNMKRQYRNEQNKYINELQVTLKTNMYRNLLPTILELTRFVKSNYNNANKYSIKGTIERAQKVIDEYKPFLSEEIDKCLEGIIYMCSYVMGDVEWQYEKIYDAIPSLNEADKNPETADLCGIIDCFEKSIINLISRDMHQVMHVTKEQKEEKKKEARNAVK